MRKSMKRIMVRGAVPTSLLLAGFLLIGATSPVLAEDLVAEVPFEFVVNGQTFEPGTYEVDIGTGIADAPVLAIQTVTQDDEELRFKKVLTSTTIPVDQAEGQPRLVFKKVGDMFFLEKVVPRTGAVQEVR
jgi:hypothetical protein